jgi:hypothetical protein
MFRTLTRAILMLLAGSAAVWLMAAGTSIGIAVTKGGFLVDHAHISGNATLFDGSSVETATAASRLQLNNGVVVRLDADARATVYQRRLILERGVGQMESAGLPNHGYEVEARSLHISPSTNDTVTRISLLNARQVQVGALRGAVRVTNSTGLLVARLEAGNSMSFEPDEAGASVPTRASGCLVGKDGKVILSDQTTNVVLELQGKDLDSQIGNRIQITGTAVKDSPPVSGAPQVIRVTEVRLVHKGGCAAIAKKLGGSAVAGAVAAGAGAAGAGPAGAGAAGAATATGISIGTIAVIGGVASAAALGGLALSGTLSSDSGASPSASR